MGWILLWIVTGLVTYILFLTKGKKFLEDFAVEELKKEWYIFLIAGPMGLVSFFLLYLGKLE